MKFEEAISFIRKFKRTHPSADKAAVQHAFTEQFSPKKSRSVWIGDGYAIRFSQARGNSFSNTVLSLSALKAHDDRPFVVVVVRKHGVDFFLANATFLKKISHSSHELRFDNIKGSFNGTDIMAEYGGIRNIPENFAYLFEQHHTFTWEENLTRLVEATNAIVGRDTRFRPTKGQVEILMSAPERAEIALSNQVYKATEAEIAAIVEDHHADILAAACIDNVNLRGNAIEQIITAKGNAHELGDLERDIGNGQPLVIDIKTKLLDRASAPKAYNIDKMLSFLSQQGSVFAFFLIGVDIESQSVNSRLLPVLETALLDATVIQHHWAGRASRGVTQLSGRFERANEPSYKPTIDIARAKAFLKKLLEL